MKSKNKKWKMKKKKSEEKKWRIKVKKNEDKSEEKVREIKSRQNMYFFFIFFYENIDKAKKR